MEVKKKVVSMMLALTLVFSEIPASTSNAAEISSDNVEAVEETETETETTKIAETESTEAENTEGTITQDTEIENTEKQDAEEQNTENQNSEATENAEWVVKPEIKTAAVKRPADDIAAFHVAENGKAVGSDGVLYEDVVYLSADTVRALDEDMQSVYFEVCDSIAELKAQEDALNGAVIAVDEDGNLHYSISLPTKRLADGTLFQKSSNKALAVADKNESITELSTEEAESTVETIKEDLKEESSVEEADTEDVSTETEPAENKSEQETAEDKTSTETDTKEETSAEESSVVGESKEDVSTNEEATEETSSDERSTEDASTENTTTEEVSEEETTEEEAATEESSEEESATELESTEDVSSVEETTEETTEIDTTETEETDTEEFVFAAENMELLEHGQAETFDVVENVKVDPIVDMGYEPNIAYSQFNSTLTSKTYFKNQLDDVEKKIYDAGVNKLTKGTNQFEYAYQIDKINDDYNSGTIHYRTLWATSAIIMQYPYNMDWMDLSEEGKTTIGVGVYAGTQYLTGKLRLTLDKSPYYKADLVKQANSQVSKLVKEAQMYAEENYPNDIVYGVVKYFDDWICKNNYYDMIGVYGGNATDSSAEKEAYYYCHSSYGILLKGYGVCESYALAMTRLLDALNIPNMYATGYAGTPENGGGHAWNYVGMPNGKWYLQDSTWNDDTDPNHIISYGDYLLCADDGMHKPEGGRWVFKNDERGFQFVSVNTTNYDPQSQTSLLVQKEYSLKPKETSQLSFHADYASIYKPTYRSSDVKVAKVDKNGKITAVSAGQAIITATYNITGMGAVSDTCTVNVMQVKSLVAQRTNKTNDTVSVGMGTTQYITLKADCGNGIYDAEKLLNDEAIGIKPDIKLPKNNVAEITYDREKSQGNSVVFKISPLKAGNASYKITIDKKSVTLKVSVGEIIKREWFKVDADYIVDGKTPYTGKALKPKVVKNNEASDIPSDLKFKVAYYNNKDIVDGKKASIVVSGTGKYAGEETFEFEIQSLPIAEGNVLTASMKASQNIAYNGGVNQAKATVKYKNGNTKINLKAGVDYDIVYNYNGIETTQPKEAGTYSIVVIRGKGNFNGTYAVSGATYTIKTNSLKKAKVTFTPDYEAIVKIGKNELSSSEYTIEYYTDKNCTNKLSAKPRIKGTYYVMVRPSQAANANLTDEKKVTLKVK